MLATKTINSLRWYKIIPVLFSLPLLVLLTGCPYESRNPLSLPAEAKIDNKLIGKWKLEDKEKGDAGLVTISRFNNTELLIILEEDGKKEQEMMRGFVTSIAGEKFLNLQDIKGGYEARRWTFARYTTGDCILTYRILNDSIAPSGADHDLSSGQLYELIKKNLGNTHIYDGETTLACVGK